MRKLILSLVLLAGLAWSAPATTAISDTVFNADGTVMTGEILIQWATFQASDGTIIVGNQRRVTVTSGVVSTSLVPGIYTATYYVAGRQISRETWEVPVSAVAVRIAPIRIAPAAGTPSVSATALRGVAIDATPPTNGAVLQFDQASGKYIAQILSPGAHAASHASAGSDPLTLGISQVTNLQTLLDGKASSTHASTHASAGSDALTLAISQITDLATTLSGKADVGHNHDSLYPRLDDAYANPTWIQSLAHTKITGHTWPAYTSGADAPTGACTAPAIYAETTSDPDVFYHCLAGGTWAQIGGTGSGEGTHWPATASTWLYADGSSAASLASGRSAYADVTVTGVTAGTVLAIGPDANLPAGISLQTPETRGTNSVRIWIHNDSLAAVSPGSLDFTLAANGGVAGGGVPGSDDQTAAEVPSTPAGNLAATDVQAALNELDNEKAAAAHNHDGSAINTGTVNPARLGSGTPGSGNYLRGDGQWAAPAGNLPDATGKVRYTLKTTTAGDGYELIKSVDGTGFECERVGDEDVCGIDSTIVPTLAGDNSFKGKFTLSNFLVTAPSTTQTLAAGDQILFASNAIRQISSASAIESTAAPTLADADDGQHIYLLNVGAYSITLQDEAQLTGSNLCTVGDTDVVLPPNGMTHFVFSAASGCWSQVIGGTPAGSGAVDSVFGRTGAVAATNGDYNAGQVTNTPAGNIAAATVQAAIDELDSEKAASGHTHSGVYEPANANIQSHIASSANPHSVTKSQVGLGSADNTSDADKPVSTATQTALNAKADLSHATRHQNGGADEIATATPGANAIPKAGAGGTLGTGWIPDLSGTYSVTGHGHAGTYEPANANIQTHISSTANPHSVTKSQVGLGNVDNTSDTDKPISTATQTALDGKSSTGHTHTQTRSCEIHIWGSGTGQALQDADDEVASCLNVFGVTETIAAVRCWANAGSPTVTPIVTGGGATSILTGALTCGTASWASGTLNGTPTVSSLGSIDANITTAGGTATNIRLVLTLTR